MFSKDPDKLIQRCTNCNYLILPSRLDLICKPSPQDFLLCPHCREWMRWNSQLEVRPLTEKDIEDIPEPFYQRFQQTEQYHRMFCDDVH